MIENADKLKSEFWNASDDTFFDRKTTACVVLRSMGWMELTATNGKGIPYYKNGRRCMYKKTDTLKWLKENSQFVTSTSDYKKMNTDAAKDMFGLFLDADKFLLKQIKTLECRIKVIEGALKFLGDKPGYRKEVERLILLNKEVQPE